MLTLWQIVRRSLVKLHKCLGLLAIGAVAIAAATLFSCTNDAGTGENSLAPSPVIYTVVEESSATIREVTFVNNGYGVGVTRIRVLDKDGTESFAKYDIEGYHPYIVSGMKGILQYVYRNKGYLSESSYFSRFCVPEVGISAACTKEPR